MQPPQYRLNDSEKSAILQAVADALRQPAEGIVAVYVFGSFLKARAFADIDIGVLLGAPPPAALAYELHLERRLGELVGFPVDVRVLNAAPITFSQAVIRGQVIVDADPNRRAEFENLVLRRYFDFAPHRRRYLAEVLNAPV